MSVDYQLLGMWVVVERQGGWCTKINERPASTLYGGWTAVKQIGRSSEGFAVASILLFMLASR